MEWTLCCGGVIGVVDWRLVSPLFDAPHTHTHARAPITTHTSTQVGFSLFNSSKMALDLGDAAMVAQLKQYGVQDKALQAARMFQQALGPSGLAGGALDEASEQKKTKEKQPALYVNSPVDGYCGVCGVEGGVGGPGAASCEYQDSCDGAKPPPGFEGLVE